MTYEPARPIYTIPFNGTTYAVEGTFECIEAVERAFTDSFASLMVKAVNGFPIKDMATLLHAVLSTNGHRLSRQEIGAALLDIGIAGSDYTVFCLHVHTFMRLALTPPKDRDEVRREMGEMIGKAQTPSPGGDSNNTASAS